MKLYSVRSILWFEEHGTYEERITLWRARSESSAREMAASEAQEYTERCGATSVGHVAAYATDSHDISNGMTVFSQVRTSELAADEYVPYHFQSGGERVELVTEEQVRAGADSPDEPSSGEQGWYTIRDLFCDDDERNFVERVTLWHADNAEEAMGMAEASAELHADATGLTELIFSQSFWLFDDPHVQGAEVFSLMRESDLDAAAYVSRFFVTGRETTELPPSG